MGIDEFCEAGCLVRLLAHMFKKSDGGFAHPSKILQSLCRFRAHQGIPELFGQATAFSMLKAKKKASVHFSVRPVQCPRWARCEFICISQVSATFLPVDSLTWKGIHFRSMTLHAPPSDVNRGRESREAAPAAQGQARTGPENLLGSIPCPQQKTLCQRLVSLVAGTLPYIRKKTLNTDVSVLFRPTKPPDPLCRN